MDLINRNEVKKIDSQHHFVFYKPSGMNIIFIETGDSDLLVGDCRCNTDAFVQVAYQKILQLSYVDKFLSDIQLEFRNKYKDELTHGNVSGNFDFGTTFHDLLRQREEESKLEARAPK